ncbi:hypothetical protein SSS_07449 [Sarcoptes scabiei]|uniref:Uncharacterized protein n=1 Tax=Sarcoptes scabiei TaxID=52283 RepID=A0A834VH45_SARSC|nr:hypothetical protein SSS_07449 [Sarcoptes scabiei]
MINTESIHSSQTSQPEIVCFETYPEIAFSTNANHQITMPVDTNRFDTKTSRSILSNRPMVAIEIGPERKEIEMKPLMKSNEIIAEENFDQETNKSPFLGMEFDLNPSNRNGAAGAWNKRLSAWNKLQPAWGKRRSITIGTRSWNNLNGAWGRKRTEWNDLQNDLFEKRTATWNKMSSAWGKKKRSATLQNWNKLRGIWGKKRSNNTSDLISNPHLAMKESVTNRPATNGDYGTKQRSVENQSNSRNLQEKDLNRID